VHRMRDAIFSLQIPHAQSTFGRISVSVGVASCVPSQQDGDINRLLQAADAALYRAKIAGRNQVLVAELPLPIPMKKASDAV